MKSLVTCLLCCLSLIANAEIYEHRYFNANFPDTDPEHFKVSGNDNCDQILYRNDSVTLKIAVLPLGLSLSHPEWLYSELGYGSTNIENVSECSLSGKQAIKVSSERANSDELHSHSNFYLFSNGEVTLILVETDNNSPIDWWSENIDLKIEDLPTRSLSERTNDLENFFNRLLSDDDSKMQITREEGHIKIEVAEQNPASADNGEHGAMISVYRLIKIFSVFEEYANLGYLISIKICDGNGDVVSNRTFTPEEYLSWSDATFTEETVPEDMDGEEPETVVEVAVSIEPVNELIGIAYDGERYGLYNLARQKYLTEMSYRSLSLSVEDETDLGHAYCFKCIKEDGTEGEVTVIKGPDYTIAITDSQ